MSIDTAPAPAPVTEEIDAVDLPPIIDDEPPMTRSEFHGRHRAPRTRSLPKPVHAVLHGLTALAVGTTIFAVANAATGSNLPLQPSADSTTSTSSTTTATSSSAVSTSAVVMAGPAATSAVGSPSASPAASTAAATPSPAKPSATPSPAKPAVAKPAVAKPSARDDAAARAEAQAREAEARAAAAQQAAADRAAQAAADQRAAQAAADRIAAAKARAAAAEAAAAQAAAAPAPAPVVVQPAAPPPPAVPAGPTKPSISSMSCYKATKTADGGFTLKSNITFSTGGAGATISWDLGSYRMTSKVVANSNRANAWSGTVYEPRCTVTVTTAYGSVTRTAGA